jgi:hypothetical protein
VSDANLLCGLDTALLMTPFGIMLAAWMFGLDQRLASPRTKRRRAFSLTAVNGRAVLTDPDGKPWRIRPRSS